MLCCFCVVVLRQNLETLIAYIFVPGEAEQGLASLEWVVFGAGLLVFILGALVFYRITAGIIRAESERRVKEQNLIYAAIAHDLKTPMTSVQGYAAALREGKIPPDEQAEALGIICSKCRHMNELVDSLFEYARLGTEEYRLKTEPIDAAKITREIAAENYADFEEHGIELDTDISEEPLTVRGDAREFRRAVTNLIINAWKHNEPGTKVKITAAAKDGILLIAVADNGSQIPQQQRDAILQPFVTADASRTSHGGGGLGLAISARVIALMGGTLRIADAEKPYLKAFEITGLHQMAG